jgi:hypothetical protein
LSGVALRGLVSWNALGTHRTSQPAEETLIARVEGRFDVKLKGLKAVRREGKDPVVSADCNRVEAEDHLLITPPDVLGNWLVRDVLLAP